MTPPAAALLDFWFGPLDAGFASAAISQRWFAGARAFDEDVRARFGALPPAARAGTLDGWLATTRGRLAFVLVCDQLPRNLYRGSADAFAWDPLARAAALAGIEAGADLTLEFDERAFFYLPFEHSESVADQERSVALFTRLRDDTPRGLRHITGNYLRYAHEHRDIVARFGRFPHRNAVLGRRSTPDELEFVAGSGSFGQTPAQPGAQ